MKYSASESDYSEVDRWSKVERGGRKRKRWQKAEEKQSFVEMIGLALYVWATCMQNSFHLSIYFAVRGALVVIVVVVVPAAALLPFSTSSSSFSSYSFAFHLNVSVSASERMCVFCLSARSLTCLFIYVLPMTGFTPITLHNIRTCLS